MPTSPTFIHSKTLRHKLFQLTLRERLSARVMPELKTFRRTILRPNSPELKATHLIQTSALHIPPPKTNNTNSVIPLPQQQLPHHHQKPPLQPPTLFSSRTSDVATPLPRQGSTTIRSSQSAPGLNTRLFDQNKSVETLAREIEQKNYDYMPWSDHSSTTELKKQSTPETSPSARRSMVLLEHFDLMEKTFPEFHFKLWEKDTTVPVPSSVTSNGRGGKKKRLRQRRPNTTVASPTRLKPSLAGSRLARALLRPTTATTATTATTTPSTSCMRPPSHTTT